MVDVAFIDTIATFTDANPKGKVGDHTATIDWGDNSTSGGTIRARQGGGFEVLGQHSYHHAGSYTIVVRTIGGGDPTYATSSIAVKPTQGLVDIQALKASSDDARSIRLKYAVSGSDLPAPFSVAVYRSTTADPQRFDPSSAILVGSPVAIPDTASNKARGTHSVTIQLSGEIPIDSTRTHPYLFVVVNPPGAGHLAESDDSNNVATLGTITAAKLQAIMPSSDAASFVDALNAALGERAIITPNRQAAFLGQLAVESSELTRWHELYTTKSNYQLPGNSKKPYSARDQQDYFNYWYSGKNGGGGAVL